MNTSICHCEGAPATAAIWLELIRLPQSLALLRNDVVDNKSTFTARLLIANCPLFCDNEKSTFRRILWDDQLHYLRDNGQICL